MINSALAERWERAVANGSVSHCEEEDESLPVLHSADELLSRSTEDGALTGRSANDTEQLIQVARWAKDCLTKPHPALGRPGPVCPYVSGSIREQRFLLTALHGAVTNHRETDETMLRLARYFVRLAPTSASSAHRKTIVVLFPNLPERRAGDIVDEMHQRLKPHFLRLGLMLGEFYKESSKPGLHNPEFRPLRSDTPLLVIRSMVLTDIAFLSDQASFVRAFLQNFQVRGCEAVLGYVAEKRSALSDAQISMLLEEAVRGPT
ncbi:MAG: DUF6875 domain-containing protein [Deltaproteobacteria bacterium]